MDDDLENLTIEEQQQLHQPAFMLEEKPGILFFLNQRTILINLILMTFVWITSVFNFYMINLQVKYFPGDFTVNMMVLTGSDIPATLIAGYLVHHYKPKTIFMLFYAL